jgi:TatD DNase family protein
VRAIGECGLDYNRDFSPREVQRQWFEAQVELAAELGMPLFVHERDALDDTVAVLEPHFAKVPGAVIHCFTGNEESLDRYLELGMHIGITGWICDERRGLHLREIVSRIPLDKLMLETDAPYLIPRSMRPKAKSGRNEPSYLTWVLAAVAEAYGLSEQEVAEQTTKTAERFFDLGERGADSGAQS